MIHYSKDTPRGVRGTNTYHFCGYTHWCAINGEQFHYNKLEVQKVLKGIDIVISINKAFTWMESIFGQDPWYQVYTRRRGLSQEERDFLEWLALSDVEDTEEMIEQDGNRQNVL